MRLILIPLFMFISSVISINENDKSDQRVVQGRYNLNHPPWAENYDPIPVAIFYEDDAVTGKAIKPEVEQKPESNIAEVSQTNEENKESVTTQRIEISTAVKKSETDSKQDKILVKTKARALLELQIPVAVVYDSVTENTQNYQQAKSSDAKNNRRFKQLRRRKQQDKTSIKAEKLVIQNIEPVRPQTRTETKKEESVKPQLRQTEFIIPQSQSVNRKSEPIEQNTSKPRKRERAPVVPIVNSENYVFSHNGNFHYSYEGGDGTKAHSEGQLMRNLNDEAAGEAVSGGFSYTDKDGNDFSLSYTADENGYRPIGAHLPTPPPIPPAIARALAYLATATTPEPVTKPSVKEKKQLN